MKKLISVMLACFFAAAMLAACSGNTSSSVPSSSAPPASVSVPASSSVPAPPSTKAATLTGAEVPLNYGGGRRIGAVIVDNVSLVEEQRGLSLADILFELPLEGGLTRYMALYEDYQFMPVVGPVRSIRDSFIQLAMPWQPLMVSAGSSALALHTVEDFDLAHLMLDPSFGFASAAYEADNARSSNTANAYYTSGDIVKGLVEINNVDDLREYSSSFFHFVPYDEPARVLQGGEAAALTVQHSARFSTFFEYDTAAAHYLLSQQNPNIGDMPHAPVDEDTGLQLAFDNVFVLFADIPVHPAYQNESVKVPDIQFGNGGTGFYFSGGRAEQIFWRKSSPQHGLEILHGDRSETPVLVNPGSSYITFVDVELAKDFAFGPAGAQRSLAER